MKKLLACFLVMVLMLSLMPMSALSDTLSGRYEAAEILMIKGDYLAAADAFDLLMTYNSEQKAKILREIADDMRVLKQCWERKDYDTMMILINKCAELQSIIINNDFRPFGTDGGGGGGW